MDRASLLARPSAFKGDFGFSLGGPADSDSGGEIRAAIADLKECVQELTAEMNAVKSAVLFSQFQIASTQLRASG